MKKVRVIRNVMSAILTGMLCFAFVQVAIASDYPDKPITIICWSSPGAPNDLLARQIAKTGNKYFGVNMNVLNKKGGGGAVAMGQLLKAKTDGYTIMTTTASQVIRMASGQAPFKAEDFQFIMRVQTDPFVIAVNADSQFNNLNEFFDYAKEHPGELSMAGFGTASAHFLAFTRLKLKAGNPDVRWIAYDGGADAVVAALGGHASAVHTNPAAIQEHVEAGKMKVLGISAGKRVDAFPDYPTYTEQGYELSPVHWRGLMGPAGLSDDVVQKIRKFMEQIVADPEFVEYQKNAGVIMATLDSPAAFQEWVESETVETHKLMKELGLIKK